VTEAQFEDAVARLCQLRGVLRFHVIDSRRVVTLKGWPDDVLIGRRGILWRELKTECGELSPEQRTVGRALVQAGADWKVWRPADLDDGTITRELEAIR
jgi:hypothetical protein